MKNNLTKKFLLGVILVLVATFMFPMTVSASGGALRKETIITCNNGKRYGQHGSDNHWHAADENGKAKGSNLGTNWDCSKTTAGEKITVTLSACVDGDTAKFNYKGEVITTRFLAVDTPETKHPSKPVEPYGPEASEYTCNALKKANKIVLEYDPGSTKTDNYDRHLVWVYADDVMIQKELIRQGLAKVAYLYDDYLYTEELQALEKEAQTKKVNLWSDGATGNSSLETDCIGSEGGELATDCGTAIETPEEALIGPTKEQAEPSLSSEQIIYVIIIVGAICLVVGYVAAKKGVKISKK